MTLPERKTVIEKHEFGPFGRARIVEGEVFRIGEGRWVILERGKPKTAGGADGEADPVRARAAIKAKLRRAGATLKRCALPPETRQLLGAASTWPEVMPDLRDLHKHDRMPPPLPTARDHTELNECLGWLLVFLDGDARGVVFAMGMMGWGRRRMARIDSRKRSGDTLRRVYERGITNILSRLLAGHTTS